MERRKGGHEVTITQNVMPKEVQPAQTRVVVFLANRNKKLPDKEVRPKNGRA